MDMKAIIEEHVLDHVYGSLNLLGMSLPVSKHLLMMIITVLILAVGFPLLLKSKSRLLSPFRSMIEIVMLFIRDDIVVPNMGKEKGEAYLGYFCTLFFFILILNLLGLVPFGASATGNIAVTGALALTTFFLINFEGMKASGPIKYFATLVPQGVPFWLYPILFPIELISIVTKCFALCIRLFANMLGGHIVILSFICFIFIFGSLAAWLGWAVAPFSIILVLCMMCLELFVAFLQAYIFVFLTAIFTGMSAHPHTK